MSFSPDEVREYRDQLYKRHPESAGIVSRNMAIKDVAEFEPLPETSEYEIVRRRFSKELDFTSKPWSYPLWQVADKPDFFAYKSDGGVDGVCLLERIDLPDGRIVIACIETAGNPGCSITNCVETLCFQVCERFDIPAEKLVWLVHYEYHEHAEWSVVNFRQKPPDGRFEDPKWTDLTPKMWRDLHLKPKNKLESWHGSFESKLTKLF